MSNPLVSVIIPTYNRPELIVRAVQSVLHQSYKNFEVIVVDDGTEIRAKKALESIDDSRVRYLAQETSKGGSAARNKGIQEARGEFIAFLDDDDTWIPDKLEIQMSKFKHTPEDVGFCFSAVTNHFPDGKTEDTSVPEGIHDLHDRAIRYFKGLLTVTLVVKKKVFEMVGAFDESFPSHQESELMIRVTKEYKGLGINKALVHVHIENFRKTNPEKFKRKIRGREMLLEKWKHEFEKRPELQAKHNFWFGLAYRDLKEWSRARAYFLKAFSFKKNPRYVLHAGSMLFGGLGYRLLRR